MLLGPSGCGKTTLLRDDRRARAPRLGLDPNRRSSVAFDAAAEVDVEAGRRPVNMIFQSYALWPHMTAFRNVAFPLDVAA